jgi:hypothetical protein
MQAIQELIPEHKDTSSFFITNCNTLSRIMLVT